VDTYGLELELGPYTLTEFDLRMIKRKFPEINITTEDDGSCRGRSVVINGVSFANKLNEDGNFDENIPVTGTLQSREGLELILSPDVYDVYTSVCKRLSSVFYNVEYSNKTAIHFHVGVEGRPFWFVKNIFDICMNLEALLFKLSKGKFKKHRGESYIEDGYRGFSGYAKHKYARPLSESMQVESSVSRRKKVPLINPQGLKEAKNFDNFCFHWGQLNTLGGRYQYIPHRLHAVNAVSILRHGTVEFRLFNCDTSSLLFFLDIVHTIVEMAEDSGPEGFEPQSKDLILGVKYGISKSDAESLLENRIEIPSDIWENGGWVSDPEGQIEHHYPTWVFNEEAVEPENEMRWEEPVTKNYFRRRRG